MQKKKLLSIILCITLLFLSVFVPKTFAETKQGRITADSVKMRNKPTTVDSETINIFNAGAIVTIIGKVIGNEAVKGSGTTWYNVTYGSQTGYVYGKYVEETTPAPYDADFEKNLLNFPESYRQALKTIHNAYPNWVFKADPVNMSLDNAINLEYNAKDMTKTKKWVELTYGLEWRDPRSKAVKAGDVDTRETRWTFASRKAIAFFMDPRNGLTVTAAKASYPNIFTFMEQSYDAATQNEAGVRTIVKGTFLDTDDYVNIIMKAAKQSKVSPYIIATTIITEQGVNGKSDIISGKYEGYEEYYNYFNYGAYGDNIIKNGLQYAKENGWNSPEKAIVGGAVKYGSGYVGTGQDTYYYMDFNVFGSGNHQYASALYDQCTKAYFARPAYIEKKDGALTFKIPVYSSMPASVCAAPTMADYTASQVTPEPPAVTTGKRKGDISGDSEVNGRDLAILKAYLLGLRKLDSEKLEAADVSGDNTVNGKDLAIMTAFLLGLRTL